MQQNEYAELKDIYDNLGEFLAHSKVHVVSSGFKIKATNARNGKALIFPSLRKTARYIHCSESSLRYWFKRRTRFKKNGYYLEKVKEDNNQYQLP